MKKILTILVAVVLMTGAVSGCKNTTEEVVISPTVNNIENIDSKVSFVDDDGKRIIVDKPFERIIVLYSAHVENLYYIGAGDKIIGAHNTSIYPPEAAFLPQYDYNGDPETIIAANPDCVLLRPTIARRVPDLVEAIEKAGIPVVSLYPDTLDSFDSYIINLGLLTGTKEIAEEKLKEFHVKLNAIKELTSNIPEGERQSVFFESMETELRTTTPTSMAGLAMAMAGGNNIASDAKAMSEGGTIAAFGDERILEKANEIDVYISQRGAMNAGGNIHSISIRPGFDTIKAVKDGRIFIINEKLISSPTLRYYKGVEEIARFLYPDLMDSLVNFENDSIATKRDLANIVVKGAHLQIYTTFSSKYYEEEHKGHVYGRLLDVPWYDEDFDYIETAVMSGAISADKIDGDDYFNPDEIVTKEMLAKTVFILYDLKSKDIDKKDIADLSQCENTNIVQILIDNEIMELNGNKFEPKKEMTCKEIVQVFEKLRNMN